MKTASLLGASAVTLPFIALSGGGDTWSGLKKDTGEKLQAAGKAIHDAGKN